MGFVAGLIEESTMKWVIAMLLACAATVVSAEPRTYKDDKGNYVRLTDDPCVSTAGVLSTIPSALRPELKAATIYWEGKLFAACYRDRGTQIDIIDESGDGGTVDARAFRKDIGA